MPFKSDKQRKWMHANEPEMAKKWEKEESINEANASVIRKKLLKQFGDDPLYKDFIIAKTPKDQKKALKTLKSIRGGNAVRLMQKYVKKLQGESIKGKLRNVIRQEIKSINEIKTKDSKGKPIKPGELYYFTFIGAGRHKKPKVVKVIRNDAKGIVYHDFGDNSKYTIPMSLIKRKKMGGYFTLHESINEGFDKYHLGGLLDSKLKKRLERAIKIWGGKVDAVGDDYIKFRLSSFEVKKFPALLKKLDRNKNVWIGDKRKNNIWDRRQRINKLEATTSVSVPGYLTPNAFSKSTQKAIDTDDEDDEKSESMAAPFRRRKSRGLGRPMKVGLSEGKSKPRTGDYVKTMIGVIAKIEKVRGTIAYMKLQDRKSKGYWINDLKNLKSTDKMEKGKSLWTESIDELQMAPFSSQEARSHINSDIKDMSKHLGRASQQVIKIMMDGVRKGKYTAMDISRGIHEGPARRTHFGEMTFIQSLWTKMRDKFRRYSKDGKLS